MRQHCNSNQNCTGTLFKYGAGPHWTKSRRWGSRRLRHAPRPGHANRSFHAATGSRLHRASARSEARGKTIRRANLGPVCSCRKRFMAGSDGTFFWSLRSLLWPECIQAAVRVAGGRPARSIRGLLRNYRCVSLFRSQLVFECAAERKIEAPGAVHLATTARFSSHLKLQKFVIPSEVDGPAFLGGQQEGAGIASSVADLLARSGKSSSGAEAHHLLSS